MLNRKWFLGAIVASALSAIPVVANAAIYVNLAPPDPLVEVVPAPRAGFVWAPGYYTYRNNHYVWVKGRWERERHGKYWHPGHWVEREGRWSFVEPGWRGERFAYGTGRGYAMRDSDRDGVPNRLDRDRDGDGVPNRLDRAPDNPNRR
jgi:hypothetical protein